MATLEGYGFRDPTPAIGAAAAAAGVRARPEAVALVPPPRLAAAPAVRRALILDDAIAARPRDSRAAHGRARVDSAVGARHDPHGRGGAAPTPRACAALSRPGDPRTRVTTASARLLEGRLRARPNRARPRGDRRHGADSWHGSTAAARRRAIWRRCGCTLRRCRRSREGLAGFAAGDGPPRGARPLEPLASDLGCRPRRIDQPPDSCRRRCLSRRLGSRLDELRGMARDAGRRWMARLQEREREATGIPSLKVGNNRVFGYYHRGHASQLSRVPARYSASRRSTGGALRDPRAEGMGGEDPRAREEAPRVREAALFDALARMTRGDGELQALAPAIAELGLCLARPTPQPRGRWVRPALWIARAGAVASRRAPPGRRAALEAGTFVPNDTRPRRRGAPDRRS